jgi:subtilisin family serine protease
MTLTPSSALESVEGAPESQPGSSASESVNSLPPEIADTPVDEIIVQYARGTPATDASGDVNGSEAVVTEDVSVGESLGRGFRTVKLDRTVTADVATEVAAELAASPEILAASPNMPLEFTDLGDAPVQTLTAEISPTGSQANPLSWGLDRIDQRALPLNASYSYAQGGAGVDAYVIDNGVRSTHQDFTGRMAAGYSAYGDACSYSAGTNQGHGTHVAGTIGGTASGVAKNVTIVPVRVFSCAGGGDSARLVNAINWVISDHVAGEPAVANMSLTVGSVNSVIDAAVIGMINDGITVVAASGNTTTDACAASPAHVPAVLTVNASTSSDGVAGFSNFGVCTDIYAPGQGIWSSWYTANNAYAQLDGTSMASPHVAGLAAQILSEAGYLPPGVVGAIIKFRATPFGAAAANSPKILAFEPSSLSPYVTSSLPTIAGLAEVGQTLTASAGTWSPAPDAFAYQWRRDGAEIMGANAATYTIQADDEGHALTVSATALKNGYVSTTTFGGTTVTPSSAVRYAPLSPARLADTRSGQQTADGINPRVGMVPAGGVLTVPVLGRVGIPAAGVDAVALNVTVTQPASSGFLTVYPSGEARPLASNLNFEAGQTIPNMVIAKVGTDGQVSFFVPSATHIIVDISGYYPTVDAYTPLSPSRLADTRQTAILQGGQTLRVPVLGRGGVAVSDVGAVALNVTVVGAQGSGFVTVFPTLETRPLASNLNYSAGQTIPNMVISKVGSDGSVSIFSTTTTQIVVDVAGYFPVAGLYNPLSPARLADTRPGQQTIDHVNEGTSAVGPGQSLRVRVLGRGGVPASGVSAVVVNVTAVAPTNNGFASVFPAGDAVPNASNLNFTAGRTIPNLVIAKVGADGSISIFNAAGSTHFVVDVAGWFASS